MQQLVETVEHPIGFLLLAGQRVANNALAFAAETDPDFEQLLRVGGEGGGVLFVLDLFQGLVCGLIDFQLHDIDIVASLDGHVHAAAARVTLHLHIQPHQLEDDRQRVLEIDFHLPHHLA